VRQEESAAFGGLRICQIYGAAWGMSGDIRSRRRSHSERPLRRQDGWRAGASNHGFAVS
jgi:hypothetical protein